MCFMASMLLNHRFSIVSCFLMEIAAWEGALRSTEPTKARFLSSPPSPMLVLSCLHHQHALYFLLQTSFPVMCHVVLCCTLQCGIMARSLGVAVVPDLPNMLRQLCSVGLLGEWGVCRGGGGECWSLLRFACGLG